jgi:hypothetical protein
MTTGFHCMVLKQRETPYDEISIEKAITVKITNF